MKEFKGKVQRSFLSSSSFPPSRPKLSLGILMIYRGSEP